MQKKLLAILFVVFLVMYICSCSPVKIADKNQYLQLKNSPWIKYMIFPKDLSKISSDSEYYHSDYKFQDGIEVYLNAYYEKDEFEKEINRIEQISYKIHSSHNSKKVYKDDVELFNYVTYVAVFNFSGVFEYACVDFTNYHIVYIALYAMSYEGISFDKTYLPKNYDHMYENAENYKQYFSYNMYATNP